MVALQEEQIGVIVQIEVIQMVVHLIGLLQTEEVIKNNVYRVFKHPIHQYNIV